MKWVRVTVTYAICFVLAGCSIFRPLPEPSSYDQRLSALPTENLPLKGETSIYWDEYQIPFIEAEHDEDAAFALGLVHAHLRLGHMELARRVSRGRMSEFGGGFTYKVDRAIRTFDFERAVPEMEAALSPETRLWLEAFVAGVNHYIFNVEELPQEFAVLSLEREAWTVGDILLFSRLAGADANWSVWMTLLHLREREDWPERWALLLENGSNARTTYDELDFNEVNEVLGSFSHSGSNAMAIAPSRTRTGAALFAADPHVGYLAPAIWMLAGVKSPSMHTVGIMPTGFPYFALGRNPTSAWGGTNLYAASSSFYDVSGLDEKDIEVRTETIRLGASREVEATVRDTKWGPIITDLPMFDGFSLPDIALRWVGHEASDETGSMLAANRASTFEQFRAAYKNYAASGMNMIYADVEGNIGQVQAVKVPNRPNSPPTDIVARPEDVEPYWESLSDATTLPAVLNPAAGYVATANNKPPEGDVPVGFFFSTNDRIDRINELMEHYGTVGLDELKEMQRDVYMASSVTARDALIAKIEELDLADPRRADEREFLALVAGWDGHYRADSRGALAYEMLAREFSIAYYRPILGLISFTGLTDVVGGEFTLLNDLETADQGKIARALRRAIANATAKLDADANWGTEHRLQFVHPFVVLPLVGDRYRFGDYPFGGSIQTLMKSGHDRGGETFIPYHGASARFISDLSDLDTNYFVLSTGQDGWLNSANFLDQTEMFLAGDYIQLPLRLENVRARAVRVNELK